jgi:hypothetical protein
MRLLPTLASLFFFFVSPPPALAADEYQSYERICSKTSPLKDGARVIMAYEDCKCDFDVKSNLPGRLVSKEDPDRQEVSIYTLLDDGEKRGRVLKNCEFSGVTKGEWKCTETLSEGKSFKFIKSVRREQDKLIEVNEIIDIRNGTRYVDGLSIQTPSPMLYCHKKKSIFDFKMPWK